MDDRGQRSTAHGGEQGGNGKTSVWEWVCAALGTLLVLSTVAFMLYEAATRRNSPPALVVRVDSIHVLPRGFLVEVRAENHGGETAASVQVEGELRSDTGVVETSEATIDYVPPDGKRLAGLVFQEDPRRHVLRVRPKGFSLP